MIDVSGMKWCSICGIFYDGKRCPYKNKHNNELEGNRLNRDVEQSLKDEIPEYQIKT